jgi:hypothetical protein
MCNHPQMQQSSALTPSWAAGIAEQDRGVRHCLDVVGVLESGPSLTPQQLRQLGDVGGNEPWQLKSLLRLPAALDICE